MVAWVVINRQHLPRAARGPSQPRKSRPIRALPLAARLFNNPTFKPANDPQFPPASIPILKLTPPSSHRKSPPSFHALTWNPICNPFVFIFMHVMGGVHESVWVLGFCSSRPQHIVREWLAAHNLWPRLVVATQTRTPPCRMQRTSIRKLAKERSSPQSAGQCSSQILNTFLQRLFVSGTEH